MPRHVPPAKQLRKVQTNRTAIRAMRTPSKTKKSLPRKASVTKKTMNEPDHIAAIVVGEAKRTLKDLQTRSIEALKALDAKDYQLALGAFAGLEEQIRKTN